MKIKRIKRLFSVDLFISILISVVSFFILENEYPICIIGDIAEVCISVFSIIFAIYFAGLSLLITGSDNEFIKFLEEENQFTELLWTYKVTILILFVSLLNSLGFYILISLNKASEVELVIPRWAFIIFLFITSYGLLAALYSIFDALKFSHYRAIFLKKSGNE